MKEATEMVRIYQSDWNVLKKLAYEGDTTIARIIHEMMEKIKQAEYPENEY